MSLPESRPRTYVDGDPVIPDDLNEIFDSCIGDKHAERTLAIHPAAAQQVDGSTATYDGANQIWIGLGDLSFPLPIPAGDTLTSLRFGYARVGAGAVQASVAKINLLTGVWSAVLVLNDSTGSDWEVASFDQAALVAAGIAVLVPDGYAYSLHVSTTDDLNRVGGPIIKHVRL